MPIKIMDQLQKSGILTKIKKKNIETYISQKDVYHKRKML